MLLKHHQVSWKPNMRCTKHKKDKLSDYLFEYFFSLFREDVGFAVNFVKSWHLQNLLIYYWNTTKQVKDLAWSVQNVSAYQWTLMQNCKDKWIIVLRNQINQMRIEKDRIKVKNILSN